MMFFTMQDAVDELKPRINGGSCRSETAMARINQATRRLLNRPRKPVHIERVIRFFTYKDTITLPREVAKIMHYAMDGAPAPLFSRAYEFVSGGWGELCGCGQCNLASKYLVDMGGHYSTMFELPSLSADEDNESEPVYPSFTLAAFSTAAADVTKALKIYGRNAKNEVLGSPDPCLELPIQAWDGGVEGNLVEDLAGMNPDERRIAVSEPVRDVERVQKPATDGFVSLYAYNADTHQMYFLAKYHPQETNPQYRKYKITAPDYALGSSIYALCELGYVPQTDPDDILIVQNMDALKLMVMAIELENEREFQAAKAYDADAYRLIDEQRSAERTHDYNLIQQSPCYGFGDIRAR